MSRRRKIIWLSAVLALAGGLCLSAGGADSPSPETTVRPAAPAAAPPASQPASQPAKEITLDLGNKVTMKLVLIPAGKFTMGSAEDEKGRKYDESPRRKVVISKAFYMSDCPVTRKQFAAFVADCGYKTDAEKDGCTHTYDGKEWVHVEGASWKNPSFKEANELSIMVFGPGGSPKKCGIQQSDDHPVICVNYNDATEFCKWLSKRSDGIVQLPTEARWEYACRGESTTRFNYGDDIDYRKLGDHAWYRDNSKSQTHPVGKKKPNDWGLYDMHGNVWQWCADYFVESYADMGENDPTGPQSGPGRVLRGGSWFDIDQTCRSASRYWLPQEIRTFATGFRVLLELPLDPKLLAEVRKLVAQLDSDNYNVREAAHRKLKEMGPSIVPVLRGIEAGDKCSAEVSARLRQIIGYSDRGTGPGTIQE